MYSELLTPKEKEIIELVCKGYSNKQIAQKLTLGLCTIQTHTYHIMQKFNISDYGKCDKRLKRLKMALCYLKENKELL